MGSEMCIRDRFNAGVLEAFGSIPLETIDEIISSISRRITAILSLPRAKGQNINHAIACHQYTMQNLHEGISSCSGCGIYFQKWKKNHRQFIISAFTRSIAPPFTSNNGESEVAKNGVSFDSSISFLHKFLGAGK